MNIARSVIDDAKFRSVNFSKLKNGYLEFRSIGGHGYHLKYNEITDTISRWISVIDLACDPDASRKEYVKKVAKLFNYQK
jgi:hypothetical protein